jgi:Fe-S oxidoreductase
MRKKPCALPTGSKRDALIHMSTKATVATIQACAANPLSTAVAAATIASTNTANHRPTRPSAASTCMSFSVQWNGVYGAVQQAALIHLKLGKYLGG